MSGLIKNRFTGGMGYWAKESYTTPEGSVKYRDVWVEVMSKEQVAAEKAARRQPKKKTEGGIFSFVQAIFDWDQNREASEGSRGGPER